MKDFKVGKSYWGIGLLKTLPRKEGTVRCFSNDYDGPDVFHLMRLDDLIKYKITYRWIDNTIAFDNIKAVDGYDNDMYESFCVMDTLEVRAVLSAEDLNKYKY